MENSRTEPSPNADLLKNSQDERDSDTSSVNGGCCIVDEDVLHEEKDMSAPLIQGMDDARDLIGESSLPRQLSTEPVDVSRLSGRSEPSQDRASLDHDQDDQFLPVPVPVISTGITTFAYQRALQNRIRHSKLARHGDYDTSAFTPTFVHDCLMLPGSLANVLGKVHIVPILIDLTLWD